MISLSKPPRTMKSFHFSLGDSSAGSIGFCARITAKTPEQALQILKDALPEEHHVRTQTHRTTAGVEYISTYFNATAITVEDIDEVDDE